MFKTKIFIGTLLVLLAGLLLFASCSPGAQANTGTTGPTSAGKQAYRASWIKASISGTSVAIPVSEVLTKGIVNFKVGSSAGELAFMAYQLDGRVQVRADICPPCRSESFTLQNGKLTCDTCGTVFDAKTGAGIRGACVRYPKAQVAYENSNGTLTMKAEDLLTAFQATLSPKL